MACTYNAITKCVNCLILLANSVSSRDKALPTNWYKMAAIMNRYCENYEIEEVWEARCASLVPERSKLR
ncbi:hypothetical protein C0J52_02085 [Blattella germanica]|nr:hypothetical protein C0J52_02085 [Blattella germanica]